MTEGAILIALEPKKFGVRVGLLTPDLRSLLSRPGVRLVLAARGQVPRDVLSLELPLDIKIGPVEQIASLVNGAEAGIALGALLKAPALVPSERGACYFALDPTSRYFRDLANSAAIAVHLSPEKWQSANLELALWASVQSDPEASRAALFRGERTRCADFCCCDALILLE